MGISPAGELFGEWSNGSVRLGFTDIGGVWKNLIEPMAGTLGQTLAVGETSTGAIVGSYAPPGAGWYGFIDTKGVFKTVSDPNAAPGLYHGTFVTGVNPSGDLVGYYTDSKGVVHGFVDRGGTFTTINYTPGTRIDTWTGGIATSGVVVGYAAVGQYYRGWKLTKGFGTVRDGKQPKTGFTQPAGIAPTSGEMVGAWWTSDKVGVKGYPHGFRYQHGKFWAINDPQARYGTYPQGVTDKGLVAGYYYAEGEVPRGFVWNP